MKLFDFSTYCSYLLENDVPCHTPALAQALLSMGTKKRKPRPLVAPVKSLKRARYLTSSFHKLTHQVTLCMPPLLQWQGTGKGVVGAGRGGGSPR